MLAAPEGNKNLRVTFEVRWSSCFLFWFFFCNYEFLKAAYLSSELMLWGNLFLTESQCFLGWGTAQILIQVKISRLEFLMWTELKIDGFQEERKKPIATHIPTGSWRRFVHFQLHGLKPRRGQRSGARHKSAATSKANFMYLSDSRLSRQTAALRAWIILSRIGLL